VLQCFGGAVLVAAAPPKSKLLRFLKPTENFLQCLDETVATERIQLSMQFSVTDQMFSLSEWL
jgi:hypothetical protein